MIYIKNHTDFDGIVSGAVIYEYLIQSGVKPDNIDIQRIDYNTRLNDCVSSNDVVYFVDYSFSNEHNIEYLKELITKIKCKVVWIDHHATSIDLLNELSGYSNLDAYINIGYCGAVLAYKYCYGKMNGLTDDEYDAIKYEEIPVFLKYVNSHDLWKHDMPSTKEVECAFMCDSKVDERNLFDGRLFILDNHYGNDLVTNYIKKGGTIQQYIECNNSRVRKNAFRCKINFFGKEYNCVALNGYGNSSIFGDYLYEKYDIVILYNYTGDNFKYSLYSNNKDIECNKIAEVLGTIDGYGGGGHKGAAGFHADKLIFDNNAYIIIKKGILHAYSIKVKHKYEILSDE